MPTDTLVALVLVFVATALLTGGVAWLVVSRFLPARRRLEAMAVSQQTGVILADVRVADTDEDRIRKLSRIIPRSPKDLSRLRRRLARAGYQGVGPAALYSFAEMALPVIFGVTVISVAGMRIAAIFFALIAALVGYIRTFLFQPPGK